MALTFNDGFYFANNADVLTAVGRGSFATALQHYNLFGARELRNPNSTFNAREYVLQNDDLIRAFQNGTLLNPFQHYLSFGVAEGRAPSAALFGFDSARYLTANPDVANAVGAGKAFSSAMQHYLLFGATEGRVAQNADGTAITGVGAGQAYSLTLSSVTGKADVITGTTLNDTITGAAGALESGESINALGGTDTLTALFNPAAATTITPSLTSVENVNITNLSANLVTFDLANSTGFTSVSNTGSSGTGGVSFNTIKSTATALNVTNNSVTQTSTFTFTQGLAGTADTVNLTINNISGAAGAGIQTIDITDGAAGTNAIETLAITGTGSNRDAAGDPIANVLVNDALAARTVTFAGTGLADVSGAALTQALTIDGSKNSGGFAAHSNVTGNVTVTGGTANDTIRFTGGTFTKDDVVKLGDGKGDTLRISHADAILITAKNANTTGIETLRVDTAALSGTVDLAFFEETVGDITQARFDLGVAAGTVKGLTSGDLLRLGAAGTTGTVTVTDATKAGTLDTLNIRLVAATSGANIDFATGTGLTIDGVETIAIQSNRTTTPVAADINTLPLTIAAGKTVSVSGDTNTNLGTLGANITTLTSTIVTDKVTTAGLTATLSNGAGSTATVTTGGGADNITSAAGSDSINTGAGNDTVTFGAGSDSADLGADNDTAIVVAAELTNADAIAAGAGTDTLRVTAAGGTINDAAFTSLSGFEILTGAGGALVSLNAGTNAATAFANAIRVDQPAVAGSSFSVNGSSLIAGQTLEFRGATGTAATADTVVGGAAADKIAGGDNTATNGDTLTGNGGADIFFFRSRTEVIDASLTGAGTVASEMDRITDFAAGVDKIQLNTGTNAFATAVTFTSSATVTVATAVNAADRANLTALATAAEAAFTGVASNATAVRAYVFTTGAEITTATGLANKTFLIINDDTAAIAATDTWIDITGVTGTVSAGDFVFGNLFA